MPSGAELRARTVADLVRGLEAEHPLRVDDAYQIVVGIRVGPCCAGADPGYAASGQRLDPACLADPACVTLFQNMEPNTICDGRTPGFLCHGHWPAKCERHDKKYDARTGSGICHDKLELPTWARSTGIRRLLPWVGSVDISVGIVSKGRICQRSKTRPAGGCRRGTGSTHRQGTSRAAGRAERPGHRSRLCRGQDRKARAQDRRHLPRPDRSVVRQRLTGVAQAGVAGRFRSDPCSSRQPR